MKIRNVAVVIQNNVQFESFVNAIDIMIEKGINVDIFIPICNDDAGIATMFDDFYKKIDKSKYNVFRESLDKSYDILFETYKNDIFENLKRKLTIKYMYGLTTKPSYSLSLQINYIFDGFLCYGKEDSESLKNYGLTFQIGNIKYLNYHENKKTKSKKLTILYLPTYSIDSSIDIIGKELVKLNNKYDIIVKPHHGTEYLNNETEIKRRTFLNNNFSKVYSSKDSLCNLLEKADVVLTDMSGAVFDAICVNKPVVMYYNIQNYKFGDYISLPVQYAQKDYFVSFNNLNGNDLDYYIKAALKPNQIKEQNKLSDILFTYKNNEIKKAFLNFLKSIENDCFTDNYLKIHNIQKNEISQLIHNNYLLSDKIIEKENLDIEITLLNKTINDKDILINQQMDNLNKLTTENNNLQSTLKDVYKSTSWKITKPLRMLKNFLNKIFAILSNFKSN